MLRKPRIPLPFLLLAVCLLYAGSLSNSFHFDDFHTITDNPAVRSLGNLRRIFTDTTAFSVLPANQTYRPLVTASLAVDYALGHGYAPFWFHVSTLFWFLVLLCLLYSLVQTLLDHTEGKRDHSWEAFAVTAWLGLHPAMAETVNYVIQRGDLYCTLGCIAALLAYAQKGALRRSGLYLVPFALAMLAKPPAAVFPLLLGLFVFFFEAEPLAAGRRWRRSAFAAIPAAAVAIGLLVLQSAMTPKSYLPSILSPANYRLTQPFVWLRYFGALLLPLHLNVDTDLQPLTTINGEALAGLLFLGALIAAIWWSARQRRLYPIAFGLLWFVITQLPTSLYPLSEVENDHRMFFSFPGLMLAVVWGGVLVLRQIEKAASATQWDWLRPVLISLGVLALCGYAYGTHRRNAVWRNEATLWADDVAKSPHNGRGLMIYGLTRMRVGDAAGALALFERALPFTPNYPTLEINLGIAHGLLLQNKEAEVHFGRAIALAPADDTTHAYYGRWLLGQGRLSEASDQLRTAVALNGQRAFQRELLLSAYQQMGEDAKARQLAADTLRIVPGDAAALRALRADGGTTVPTSAAALINASLAAYQAGQYQASIEEARRALAVDPGSAEAWNNVGAGYGALHQWDPALQAEQKALQLDPHLQIAANNLHWFTAQKAAETSGGKGGNTGQVGETAAEAINQSLALHQQGRFVESRAAAGRALALDPSSAEAWNNISADDAALQQWDAAVTAAEKAIVLRPDFQLARNNLAWAREQRDRARQH